MNWWKWIGSVVYLIIYGVLLFLVLSFILGGLFDPILPNPTSKADRSHAENTSFVLKNAIAAFHTEYRDYPLLDPANDRTVDSSHDLTDILLGSDEHAKNGGRNPRRIDFYSDRAARPMEGGRHRKGITLDETGGGELWDPWGRFYRVRFDSDGNGKVENPGKPGTFLPESILVWSAGKDGDFDTWEDNVKTW
ncbi:MAG: hypothetical protein ABL994_06735 [Verrucomicrobiales bacterium]